MQAGRHQGGGRVRDGLVEHGRVQGSAQVSSEQVLCCQHWHLPMGQPSWRAWWEVLPASLKGRKAVKGWISQTDTNCIHFCCLVHFKFHSLILVLCPFIFFFLCLVDFFRICVFYYALLTLCDGFSGFLTFLFQACACTQMGRLRKKSMLSLPQTENMKLIHCQPLTALRVSLFPPVLSSRVLLLSHCLFCSDGQTE